jgi:hypothetical protein
MSKKAYSQLSILRQHEQTITELKMDKQELIQRSHNLSLELSQEKDYVELIKKENEELKEQVSRGEVFRLREKIKQIELSNKQYVLKLKQIKQNMLLFTQEHDQKIKELKKENNELKLYKDLKKKNWLNSGATLELKKDLEIRTRGRDKWRAVSNELCDENDALLKENEALKLGIIPMNDYQEENGKCSYEFSVYEDKLEESHGRKEFIRILKERMGCLHNDYCCGHNPSYAVPMDYINERLEMNDKIDLRLHPVFKLLKHHMKVASPTN